MSGEPGDFPAGGGDERELYLAWLRHLRGAIRRNLEGLSEEQARWRPDGALISVLGVVNHLTHVEWRWIDGGSWATTWSATRRSSIRGPT